MAEEQEQGNINMNVNFGRLGMNMDDTPNQIKKGVVSYALNAAVENFDANSVNYQNEPGNEFCFEFPEGFQLIGRHFIQEKNKHVFFITNPDTGDSEIGYMDNNDCVYRTYINAKCLNFNIDYPIHKSVHKITNCSTQVYWTDGLNPRRYIDLESPPWINKPGTNVCDNQLVPGVVDCNKIKVQPNYDIPQLEVTEVRNGGELEAGTYQFAIQYCDARGGGYTSYHSVTNPTPIADTFITTLNFNYNVGKSIVLNISNIDVTGYYKYFNVAVIRTVNAITSVELVGTYFIDDSNKEIIYTGQNVTDIRLSINDIFEKFPYYDVAQDVTSVRDILVWDNLASNKRINYQQIANQIELQWETWRIPSGENYSDELNATNLRGYLRDEVYAFEIVFLLRNGKQTDGFHIPGRKKNSYDSFPDVPNTNNDFIGDPDYDVFGVGYSPYWKIYNTGYKLGDSPGKDPNDPNYKGPWEYGGFAYWESTEVYPCNELVWGDLANQPIRHHKFPDLRISPINENPTIVYQNNQIVPVMTQDAVYPIGVKVSSGDILRLIATSNLTPEEKDDIVGYKIVRGDRGTNKSIVAKGILRNVGKYERQSTQYYYPNYPYNDLGIDPFLLDKSNSYTTNSLQAGSGQGVCRSFNLYADNSGPAVFEYTDCFTNETKVISVAPSGVEVVCALNYPKPILKSGNGFVTCNTYKRYKITARGAYFRFTPANIQANNTFTGGRSMYTYSTWTLPHGAPFQGYSTWVNFCLAFPSSFGCLQCLDDNLYSTWPSDGIYMTRFNSLGQDTGLSYYVDSLTPPIYTAGDTNYTIEEVQAVGYDLCTPQPLNGFIYPEAAYRMVFNSPETSFGQPFLGDILKLETVMFGAGQAHFVQVKKNAMYRLLTKEAQIDALNSSYDIANLTGTLDAGAMFTAYQAYLQIYVNGITRRNYAYSFNSIANYDYWSIVENNQTSNGIVGIKQRPLTIAQYLIPGVQNVGDDHNINNFSRESSVYIKTTEEKRNLSVIYSDYSICNNNPTTYSGPPNNIFEGVVLYFRIDDPLTGPAEVSVQPIPYNSTTPNCITVQSTIIPIFSRAEIINSNGQLSPAPPNTNFIVTATSTSSIIISSPVRPLPYPNQTPSLLSGTTSLISDNTRFTIGDSITTRGTDCSKPEKLIDTKVVAYYGSIKNIFVNQWGQIYSYDTIDTGFQRDFSTITADSETMFGGDTFICRFAFKTKLPFFIDNRVNAPDDSDIFYDEIGNVAYPRYWHSARSVLSNYSYGSASLQNIISFKAHNFDCPNNQEPKLNNLNRTFYDGKMYMFAYGIPNFYCESSINVDLRQAFNSKEGDFWPHVSTSIPDDWVQESYVPIIQDNTYYYNVTFSKQNKENFFSHLPVDWNNNQCYTYFPFRAIYSDPQEDYTDNSINNWLIYRPVSKFDFPQNYGNLTSLDGIQNKNILARFENKTLLYNNLLTIDTSNPQAAYIGNNKLFEGAPPIDFAETDLGYVGSQHKFLLKIPYGQITIDAKRGNVFLITGEGAKDLAAFGSGMNRFFTDHLAFEILRYFPKVNVDNNYKNIGLHGVFDSKYDRMIITKLDYIPLLPNIIYDETDQEFYLVETVDNTPVRTLIYVTDEEYFCNKSWSVSYNFNTDSWVSFHSYQPNWYIGENNFFYSGLNGSCFIGAFAGEIVPEPTTTSTTTTEDPCGCIRFINVDQFKNNDIKYTDCDGNTVLDMVNANSFKDVCGSNPDDFGNPQVLYYHNGHCTFFSPIDDKWYCYNTSTTTGNPAQNPCNFNFFVLDVTPSPSTTTSTSTSTTTSSTTSTTTTICPNCFTIRVTNNSNCERDVTLTSCRDDEFTYTVPPYKSVRECVCSIPVLPTHFVYDILNDDCQYFYCYTFTNNGTSSAVVNYVPYDPNNDPNYVGISNSYIQSTIAAGKSLCVCAYYGTPFTNSSDVIIAGGTLACSSSTQTCGQCETVCAPVKLGFTSDFDCGCLTVTYSVDSLPAGAAYLQWIIPPLGTIISSTATSITVSYPYGPIVGNVIVYGVSPCGTVGPSDSISVNHNVCTTSTTSTTSTSTTDTPKPPIP